MKVGIPLGWPDAPAAIGPEVVRLARRAEDAGLDSLWTADHLFQIPVTGLPRESPMLEAYATVGYVLGQTSRIAVGAMVTCVAYRHPGMLLKAVTTLDVLSGGRVVLGLGAGWDEEEARSLGIPFPPTGERFERLEETLRIADHMWRGDTSPFAGTHYRLERPVNSPPALQRPHPPILVGGSGERRTLRLVAQYADACNFFDLPAPYAEDLRHKLDVLRAHCEAVGRDYDAIEKTTLTSVDVDAGADGLRRLVAHVEDLAGLGIGHVILMGPRFDWGEGLRDLDAVLSVADDLRAVEAVAAA